LFTTPVLAVNDKLMHFGAGIGIYYMSEQLGYDNPLLFVSLVGISKELHDLNSDKHTFELKDIFATTLGGLIMWQLRW
jgi:hypothetical protein